MKKIMFIIFAMTLSTWTMMSCGEKKEETKKEDDGYGDASVEADKPSSDDLIAQGKTLVDASDCKTCHHATNKIIGPSHTDVAKKYEFTQGNIAMLAGKIIAGGQGVWGEVPMTAHPDITKADAEKMAMYVLSLDGEKPKD
jgi:cytochrome c